MEKYNGMTARELAQYALNCEEAQELNKHPVASKNYYPNGIIKDLANALITAENDKDEAYKAIEEVKRKSAINVERIEFVPYKENSIIYNYFSLEDDIRFGDMLNYVEKEYFVEKYFKHPMVKVDIIGYTSDKNIINIGSLISYYANTVPEVTRFKNNSKKINKIIDDIRTEDRKKIISDYLFEQIAPYNKGIFLFISDFLVIPEFKQDKFKLFRACLSIVSDSYSGVYALVDDSNDANFFLDYGFKFVNEEEKTMYLTEENAW